MCICLLLISVSSIAKIPIELFNFSWIYRTGICKYIILLIYTLVAIVCGKGCHAIGVNPYLPFHRVLATVIGCCNIPGFISAQCSIFMCGIVVSIPLAIGKLPQTGECTFCNGRKIGKY